VSAPGLIPTRTPPLCVADDATFWPWLSSPQIESWPNPGSTVVIVPLAGLADWGLGHPLDAEETVLMAVLRDACGLIANDRKPLVVPPLRFAFGADPSCAFPVDPPTTHALIAEVAASIAAARFQKIAIVNSSPWNEELCGAAARDLRVSRGLHMFLVHLSAIELDFHPVRSRSRRRLQTLLTSLYGSEPEPPESGAP
jgi:creatinine amidohydrolase/Fe(II)-dependent formamide hydrolase-like protein